MGKNKPQINRSAESLQAPSSGYPVWLRPAVQAGFVVFSLLLGWEFHVFVKALASGHGPAETLRPAAVEAYLPISSLMSLIYLAKSGIANQVHPAGLVIFSLTVVLAMAMRRGFCSWVCPFGTLSEWAYKGGACLLGRNLVMPKWLDRALRMLKFLLLGFFLYSIGRMSVEALEYFIHGPYNRVADIKMYEFVRHPSLLTVMVLAALLVFSVLFRNFWCRYLCPYGALLGLFSWISPLHIRRQESLCRQCGRCGQVCPNRLDPRTEKRVRSLECTACYSCVSACPHPGALQMAVARTHHGVPVMIYGLITLAAFLFAGPISRTVGYWQSDTTGTQYRQWYHSMATIRHPSTTPSFSTDRPDPAPDTPLNRPHSPDHTLSCPYRYNHEHADQ